MGGFWPPTMTPVNSLETKLRALLTDPNTLTWSFFTPLAAAPLWIIVRHHPELDGSGLIAPAGKNPQICIFNFPQGALIGLYTAGARAQEAFTKWNISKHDWTIVSAPGYQLLKLLTTFEAGLTINLGLKDCQYHLDPDMVEILLSRPEPAYGPQPARKINLQPAGDPEQHLAALREFLGRQPKVRAAWIFGQKPDSPLPANGRSYEFSLLMDDPEDKSLLPEIEMMVKALTPVEMEWTTAVLMADDQSLRNLTKKKQPFYARTDFLKA
jgi:SseB protein C-terminal domain